MEQVDGVPAEQTQDVQPESTPQGNPLDRFIEANPEAADALRQRVAQEADYRARDRSREYEQQLQQRDYAMYSLQQQLDSVQQQLAKTAQVPTVPEPQEDPIREYQEAREAGDVAAEAAALKKVVDSRLQQQVPELTEHAIESTSERNQQALLADHQTHTEQLQWMLEQTGMKARLQAEAGKPDGSLDETHPLMQRLNSAYREATLATNGLVGSQNWRNVFTSMRNTIGGYVREQRAQTAQPQGTNFRPTFGSPSPQAQTSIKGLFQTNPDSKELEYTGGDIPDKGFVNGLTSEQAKAVQNHFDNLFTG